MNSQQKKKDLAGKIQHKSKFAISDRGDPRGIRQEFVPKRKEGLFEKKEATHEQFRKAIEHTGNIDVYYKGKKRFSRGM